MTSLGYYLLFGFTWLISLIPFWLLYRISDILYLIIYYIVGYRKKIVFSNLRRSFPEKDKKEIDRIAKKFYRHFCDFLVEFIKNFSIPLKQHEKRFKYQNLELIHQLGEEGKDFALVMAHYNNWEWLLFFPLKIVHKLLAIYRPLQNKAMDRLSRKMRNRYNPLLTPMEHIFRQAMNYRSEKRLFSILFLADQRPPRSNHFWTIFLNQETSFFEGVEKISQKMNLAVIFLDIQKKKRGYYEARFVELFHNAAETGKNEIMLSCIHQMDKQITANPAYWLWSHNRFKHKRPENIKLISA